MGKLKSEALKKDSEDIQTHKLTNQEIAYLRLLNISLTYHTLGQKIMSGFLYYIATTRLGYPNNKNTNLQFELDLEKDDNELTIKLIPDEILENLKKDK